jgi:hypothetical protein
MIGTNYAESVGEFQPRVAATLDLMQPKNRNAESVGERLVGAFANSFRVLEIV